MICCREDVYKRIDCEGMLTELVNILLFSTGTYHLSDNWSGQENVQSHLSAVICCCSMLLQYVAAVWSLRYVIDARRLYKDVLPWSLPQRMWSNVPELSLAFCYHNKSPEEKWYFHLQDFNKRKSANKSQHSYLFNKIHKKKNRKREKLIKMQRSTWIGVIKGL